MLLRVSHVTRFGFEEPAWGSFNQLCLRPNDDDRQTLRAFALEVDPVDVPGRVEGFVVPGRDDEVAKRFGPLGRHAGA